MFNKLEILESHKELDNQIIRPHIELNNRFDNLSDDKNIIGTIDEMEELEFKSELTLEK